MPIKIDITPLLNGVGGTLKIEEEETVSYPEDNLILTSPVRVTGKFVNAGEVIVFAGKVKTTVLINCAHCLKEFEYPLEFEFEEEYNREGKLEGKDFVFSIDPDNTIDLLEIIRQNILTELPIRPLCSEKCLEPEVKEKDKE
ncbi:MAG: DUF177 domain-containing protein [Candidatus Margulisiibacteriota bacterium]